jgi:tetratricopeptide (TPR) repeat protein
MPYVRSKGHQLCIVHGERNARTGQVGQRVLFTLYSKAEALSAIGAGRTMFRALVEAEFVGALDWKKIDEEIRARLDVLPDLYPYRERFENAFRGRLVAFARELIVADETSSAGAHLIDFHRPELLYVKTLIERRLRTPATAPGIVKDNPFFWRASSSRHEPPAEVCDALGDLYERHDHDQARTLAGVLIEAWPEYAPGHGVLGLIAREANNLDSAIAHFERGLEVARGLLPRRVPRDSWWSNLDTRPYIRMLLWLAQTENWRGSYGPANARCDQLEKECRQDLTAAMTRGHIAMNEGRCDVAKMSASYIVNIYSQESFTLSFALLELGDLDGAAVYALHGALKYPRAAQALAGLPQAQAAARTHEEADDEGLARELRRDLHAYLARHGRKTRAFLKDLLERRSVQLLLEEATTVRAKRHEERGGDRTWFDRMTQMSSIQFARDELERQQTSKHPKTSASQRSTSSPTTPTPAGLRSLDPGSGLEVLRAFLPERADRVLVHLLPVSMRFGPEKLRALVEETLQRQPAQGDVFVFTNARRTSLLLYFLDDTGERTLERRLSGKVALPELHDDGLPWAMIDPATFQAVMQ